MISDSCRGSNGFDVKCSQCGRYVISTTLEAELANQQRWPTERETVAAAVRWAFESEEKVLLCSMPDVLGLVRRHILSQEQSSRP
jgi:hypothetical protein